MAERISRLIGIPKILSVWESRGSFVLPPRRFSRRLFSPPPLPLPLSLFLSFSLSRKKHRIFITVPVTNKLLIPCRVLDSHFCRLPVPAPALPPPPRPSSLVPPRALSSLPRDSSSSPASSPFLNSRLSRVLSHCRPIPTASSNVHFSLPLHRAPPSPARGTRASPRIRDPPAQRPPSHPSGATFLASLAPRALPSCFALIQKPTWAVCSYRCA